MENRQLEEILLLRTGGPYMGHSLQGRSLVTTAQVPKADA